MKKLRPTTINKRDTCLSYCLKRTGTETNIQFAENLQCEFDFIPVKETKLEVGDIIGWHKKIETIIAETSISESGRLVSESVFTKFHLGVVEDTHLISDLTRSTNEYYIPSIRIRTISLICDDYQKFCPYPDFVIRKKQLDE